MTSVKNTNTKVASSTPVNLYKWRHRDWLDIPDFFKFVRSLPRGEQFRWAREVTLIYEKSWNGIVEHNNNKMVNKFVDFLREMHVNHPFAKVSREDRNGKFGKLSAQGLEDLIKLPKEVREMMSTAKGAAEKVDKLLVDVSECNIVGDLSTTVNQIRDAGHEVTTLVEKFNSVYNDIVVTLQQRIEQSCLNANSAMGWVPTYIMFVAKIFSVAVLLSNPSNLTFSNVLAILTLAIPSIVGGNLSFVTSLIRVVKGVMGFVQAQADDDDQSFIMVFYNLTKDMFKGMFGSVDHEAFTKMSISTKKVRVVADYLKGATTIFDMFFRLLDKLVVFIGDGIMKYYGYIPWFLKEDRIKGIVDRFVDMKEKRLDLNASTNKHSAKVVSELYTDIMKIEAQFAKNTYNRDVYCRVVPYIRVMLRSLENIISKIPKHILDGKDMRRAKPFWIYIYGEPRIGKSALFQPYLVNKLVKELGIREQYEDYTNYTYFRNCGEKFWEKYANHPVLWYNDLFQNYTDEEAMQLAIMELTNVIDDSLYPLNMAFEEKHGVYFNSEIVISNAQNDIIGQSFIKNRCLSEGTHLYARRNIVVEFCLNDKYLHRSGVGIDYAIVNKAMIDSPCVGIQTPLFPKDMYILKFHDIMSGNLVCTKFFEEGVLHIIQEAKRFRMEQDGFKTNLYQHFTEMWAQTGESTVQSHSDECFIDANADMADEVYINSFIEELKNKTVSTYDFFKTCDLKVLLGSSMVMGYIRDFYARGDATTDTLLATAISVMTKYMVLSNKWYTHFKTSVMGVVDSIKIRVREFVSNNKILVGLSVVGLIGIVISFVSSQYKDTKQPLAQTSEGETKRNVKQIKRIKKKEKIIAQSYDDQNVVVETQLKSHICKFTFVLTSEDKVIENRVFGSGINVGSDIFMLPAHFWHRWVEMKKFYEEEARGKGETKYKTNIRVYWTQEQYSDVPWSCISSWEPGYTHLEDIIFLRFRHLIQMKHIAKFFVKENDEPVLFETYLYGLRSSDFAPSTISVTKTEFVTNVTYSHEARVEPYFKKQFKEREIHVPVCFRYHNSLTTGGDCGLMLVHTDSRMNCRKILGMHTAGSPKNNLGISNAIYQEDIHEAFKNLYKNETKIIVEEGPLDTSLIVTQSNEYKELENCGLPVLGCKHDYQGKKFHLTMPRKSKIQHSVVFDAMEEDFGPTTVAPAVLRPVKRGDEVISPLYNGLKKIARVSNMVDEGSVEIIKQHMLNTMNDWHSSYKDMRVLTDFETVNGYGLLKPMDMSTSAGFPYVTIDNTNGKLPFFKTLSDEPKIFEMGDLVRKEFEDRENKARVGIVKETYFMDTLKDETRDLDKIESVKSRVFQISPVDFNMLMRKYFGTFIAFCHSIYLEGEMSVGINANSYEWTLMIRDLLSNSDQFINGDGKNFDASIGQQYMMHVCDVVNSFYDDGMENALIRRVIFATFMNSRHIVGNYVYFARQGNKSGIALTTIFNNLAGMFAIRYAYLLCFGTLDEFHDVVKAKFYGDDDLISVKKRTGYQQFDSQFYQKVWRYLGVEYTSAQKEDILRPYYQLEDLSFLQRSFVLDDKNNYYLPRLKYNTITEIARWSHSDPYNMEDQLNRFNATLMEVSNYGTEKFNEFYQKFVDYCKNINEMGLIMKASRLFTYQTSLSKIFPERYGFLNNECSDRGSVTDNDAILLTFGGSGSE